MEIFFSQSATDYEIFDHSEITLDEYFKSIDYLLASLSTAAFEGAVSGVPLLGLLLPKEIELQEYMQYTLRPYDISVIKTQNIDDFCNTIEQLVKYSEGQYNKLCQKQLKILKSYFPVYSSSTIVKTLEEYLY